MNRIGLIGDNSIPFIETLIYIWNSGNCAVIVDWRIPLKIIKEMLLEAKVKVCYIDSCLLARSSELQYSSIMFIPFDSANQNSTVLPKGLYEKFYSSYTKKEALILYSSGTTGKSKGVILSHYAINTNSDAIISYMKPTEMDCIYIVKSLAHSSTIVGELIVALKSKMKLIVAPTLVSPSQVLKTISLTKTSIICLNPTYLSILSKEVKQNAYSINSLKKIYVSGSIFNENSLKLAEYSFKGIPIYNVYGLTEAGPRVAAQREGFHTSNSVGVAVEGVKIRIKRIKNSIVHDKRCGLIFVKTPSLFKGYVVNNKCRYFAQSKWLNTRDVGFFDSKKELYIVGRIDDLINIDAHKIFPNEVERIIKHYIKVEDCAVIALSHNNQEVLACVYVGSSIRYDSFYRILSCWLAPYEIPKRLFKTNELPYSPNGKLNRKQLAKEINEVLSLKKKE